MCEEAKDSLDFKSKPNRYKKSKTTNEAYVHQYADKASQLVSNYKEKINSINNILSRELEQIVEEQELSKQVDDKNANDEQLHNKQVHVEHVLDKQSYDEQIHEMQYLDEQLHREKSYEEISFYENLDDKQPSEEQSNDKSVLNLNSLAHQHIKSQNEWSSFKFCE